MPKTWACGTWRWCCRRSSPRPLPDSCSTISKASVKAQSIPNLGYTVIFLVAVVYFALGTVFVKQIKGAR